MVATQSDSRSPLEGPVVYRSQDRRFTIIVDRDCQANVSSQHDAWLTLGTGDRQKVIEFLNSLERSTEEVDVVVSRARIREMEKSLDSMRESLETLKSRMETRQRKLTMDIDLRTRLFVTVLLAALCSVLSLWFSMTSHPLAMPSGFAAVISAFAALMSYVGTKALSQQAPRWVRWLNSIREGLANEPQMTRSPP